MRDGGFIIYLQAQVPVSDDQVKTELPEYLKNLRDRRQQEAFGEWLRHELGAAQISLPGDKPSAN